MSLLPLIPIYVFPDETNDAYTGQLKKKKIVENMSLLSSRH